MTDMTQMIRFVPRKSLETLCKGRKMLLYSIFSILLSCQILPFQCPENMGSPCSLIGSVQDLRTGAHWFDSWQNQFFSEN